MSSSALYRPSPAASLPASLVNATTNELPVLNAAANPATTPLLLIIPSGPALEGRAFNVEASGTLITTATSTATIKLYAVPSSIINAGTAATLGNDSVLGSSGAVNQNTTRAPFLVRATGCVFDSTSGKLTGKVEFLVNNTVVAAAAFSTVLASINNGNDPIVGFLLTLTPSAGTQTLNVVAFEVQF